jgi:hypothetical protein
MKKIIFALTIAMLTVVGCEKEKVAKPQTESSGNSEKRNTEARPGSYEFDAYASGYFCGSFRTCGSTGIGITRSNRIVIERWTPLNVNLIYTIYKHVSTVNNEEIFQPITKFSCDQKVVEYASGALPNNTKVIVLSTYPFNTTGPDMTKNLRCQFGEIINMEEVYNYNFAYRHAVILTTGSQAGLPCGGGDYPTD